MAKPTRINPDIVTIVIVKNPFDLNDRTIKTVEHLPIKTFVGYVRDATADFEDQEFVVSVNGHPVPREEWETTTVKGGSFIAVCPVVGKGGDKDLLGVIAGIALSIVTMGVGSWASGGTFWGTGLKAMTDWTFRGLLAATATMFVGGMLLSHMMPQPEIDKDFMQSPTYSWSKSQPLQGQGYPLGITFGTVRPTPVILAQHVSSDEDKQYLNMLLCVGEGPLDSISDITINDNPVANYDNVIVETRLGTNDQPAIKNFNDEFVDMPLNYELTTTNGWATQLADGLSAQGLEIELEFPGGLYHANNDGKLGKAYVDIQAEYRLAGGTWNTFPVGTPVYRNSVYSYDPEQGEVFDHYEYSTTPGRDAVLQSYGRIEAAQSSAVRRTYRIDNLIPGRYEVRLQCVKKSGETTRDSTRVFWTQLSQILYDDFSRPGKALIAIKALATEQLSGSMPNVSCITTRSKIWAWDPSANNGAGGYVQKDANNPAWAAYDLIHRCKKLRDIRTGQDTFVVFGAPADRLIYSEFAEWAQECVAKNLQINYFLDKATDLWSALREIENVGRGKIIMKGTRYGAICDKPAEPVQLFTVGNVIADTFQEDFLPLKDRANAVEITFTNKDKGYQRDTITVFGDDYANSDRIEVPTQITMNGITSLEQAYREAKYRLRLNKHLIRTVSFEAATDAIACQVGDVFLVQHNVPQWGDGGRILGVERDVSGDTLILDRTVEIEANVSDYSILIRRSDTDEIVQKSVKPVTEATTTDRITVTTPFDVLPAEFDVYAFGKVNVEAKPFRVVAITRSAEQTRRITAIEYVDAVYDETGSVPVINYSTLNPYVEVDNISVSEETYREKDGTVVSVLHAGWSLPRGKRSKFAVFYSNDYGQTWFKWGETDQFKVFINVKSMETYLVKVCTINDAGIVSPGVTSLPIYIFGKDTPPAPVSGFNAKEVNGGFLLSWMPNPEPDINGYSIWLGKDHAGIDTCAVIAEKLYSTSLFVPIANSGNYIFYIQAEDNSGNKSNFVTIEATFTLPPSVEGFDVVRNGDNLVFKWQPTKIIGVRYEIRRGNSWDIAERVCVTSDTMYTYFFPVPGDHMFWIKAIDQLGNYSETAVFTTTQIAQSNNRNAVYVIDQVNSQSPWEGVKINCHQFTGKLKLDGTATRGEHIVEVNLPTKMLARNWILSSVVGTTGDEMTWGSANFVWTSPEANTAWLPDGDITKVSLRHQLSRFVGFSDNIVESFSLDESVAGEKAGTSATEAVGVTYQDARYRKGVMVSDNVRLAWNLNIPAQFNTVFYARVFTTIVDHVVYMTMTGIGTRLKVGYDPSTGKFYLLDGAGNKNEISLDMRTQDIITFGIVQTATARRFMAKSFSTGALAIDERPFLPIGAFNHVALYPTG